MCRGLGPRGPKSGVVNELVFAMAPHVARLGRLDLPTTPVAAMARHRTVHAPLWPLAAAGAHLMERVGVPQTAVADAVVTDAARRQSGPSGAHEAPMVPRKQAMPWLLPGPMHRLRHASATTFLVLLPIKAFAPCCAACVFHLFMDSPSGVGSREAPEEGGRKHRAKETHAQDNACAEAAELAPVNAVVFPHFRHSLLNKRLFQREEVKHIS